MAKIVISSLFTYDPLAGQQEKTNNHESEKTDHSPIAADEFQAEIANSVMDKLADAVVEVMVDSIMTCLMKKETDHLTLLLDNQPDSMQAAALKELKKRIRNSAKIEEIRIKGNDTFEVAQALVQAIDLFNVDDEICINISSLRNTKTLGLIYGSYVRAERIKEIVCLDNQRKLSRVPIISVKLTKGQRIVLEHMKELRESKEKLSSMPYKELKLEKSSFYFILNQLKEKGFVEDADTISQMGEITLLQK